MVTKRIFAANGSISRRIERKWITVAAPYIGRFVGAKFMTCLSAAWSIGIILTASAGMSYRTSCLLLSGLILLHYFTDSLDGEIGRLSPKPAHAWGFYADHILDFIFVSALFVCYYIILPQSFSLRIVILFLGIMTLMVHSFLLVPIIGKLPTSIGWVGATELQLTGVVANIVMSICGLQPFELPLKLLQFFIPVLAIGVLIWTGIRLLDAEQ